jgi:hypothetical protein
MTCLSQELSNVLRSGRIFRASGGRVALRAQDPLGEGRYVNASSERKTAQQYDKYGRQQPIANALTVPAQEQRAIGIEIE